MPVAPGAPVSAAASDLRALHRRVVRVGAALAWLVAAIFLSLGVAGGDQGLIVEAAIPAAIGLFMTVMILSGREHGGVALVGASLLAVAAQAVVRLETLVLPTAMVSVVATAGSLLFTSKRRRELVIAGTAVLGLAPTLWGVGQPQSVLLGVVMAASYVLGVAVLVGLSDISARFGERFRLLFERSPTPLLEEDWTETLDYLRNEYPGRPERIRRFLVAYPSVVREAVGLARIVRANEAAVDLLEAGDETQLLGRRSQALVTPENMEPFAAILAALYNAEPEVVEDLHIKTTKGRPVWVEVRCVLDGPPASVVVAFADVTARRAREDELGRLIRAKDELIASISHELRTPLTAVLGLATELTEQDLPAEVRSELLETVVEQAQEMALIVEDLLVASRTDAGGKVAVAAVPVDLNLELCNAVKAIDLDIAEQSPDLPLIVGDPMRVRQILRNLLSNARRYGGSRIRVLGGSTDLLGWLEVRDDGEGVPAALADRIFEPYVTAHHQQVGSVGLGLSVSRVLAHLMGGSLSYRQEAGETVFRLELPLPGSFR